MYGKEELYMQEVRKIMLQSVPPGHGYTNIITPHDDSLEVDNTMLEGERSDKWLEVAGVQLYDEHKEGILESSSWLDDIIVTQHKIY